MGTLTAYPYNVHADSTALVVYQGEPNRSVSWSLIGSGTLQPLSSYTDGSGRAGARYIPGNTGETVTIGVTAGA